MLLLTHYGLDADKIINELKEITKRGSNTLQKKVTEAIKIIAELEKYNDKDAQDLIAILQAQVSRAKTMIGEPQNLRNNPTNIQSKTPEEKLKKANKIIVELTKIIDNVQNNPLKPIEMLQKNLKAIYFPEQPEISNEDVLQKLTQATFNPFPRLKYVLEQVFQGNADIQIPEELKDAEPQVSFQSLNTTYGYFNTDLSPLFNQLVVACHKMTTLIEHQAFDPEMAYKLMALFYDPQKSQDENASHISQKFSTLMSTKQDKTIQHPYHDALLTSLTPFPSFDKVKDLPSWQAFIAKEGFNSLPIFVKCAEHRSGFKNNQEAQTFILQQTYPHADESPELAQLCKKLLIGQAGFEAGLNEVKTGWPKKTTDNLPLVDIADETGQYFWVKLPPQDMRALYLGNLIPGCCQFINGDSQQCVKDGIARSDNGFYVLLKAEQKGSNVPRIINNEVNDKHYDIVAQSYAWKSNNGNLCLDSIEWNQKRVTTHIIQDLMSKFSEAIFSVHPSIKHITVGTAGQTPQTIYPLCTVHETIKDGFMYFDAKIQFHIASNISNGELASLKERLKSYSEEFQNNLVYLAPYFNNIDNLPDALFAVNPHIMLELTQFMQRINLPQKLSVDDFKTLSVDDYEKMEPLEQATVSTVCKIFNSQTETDLKRWLPSIPKKDLSLISFRDKDYSINFLIEFIEQCPPEKRLAAIKLKNKDVDSILFQTTSNPAALEQILKLLPPEQRLDAVREVNHLRKSFLLNAISNPPLLTILFKYLTPEQRLDAVKDKNNSGESFLFSITSNPELLINILELLSPEQRLDAVKEKNRDGETFLFKIASNPDLFNMTLNLLPAAQHLEAIKPKNIFGESILFPVASNPELFNKILNIYPITQQLSMVSAKNNKNETVLFKAASNPDLLTRILDFYPQDERLAVVKQKNHLGETVLYPAISNPESLKIILALYPQDERLAVLQEKINGNTSLLSYATARPELLSSVLDTLTPDQTFQIFSEKNRTGENKLCAFVKNPESLHAILKKLTPDQRLQMLYNKDIEGQTILFKSSINMASLLEILNFLSPEQQLQFIKGKNNYNESIIIYALNFPSLKTILEIYPLEERLSAILNEPNLVYHPKAFDIMLTCLPEEIALAIRAREKDLKTNLREVLDAASSIETFMKDIKDLANPKLVKNFVLAIINNDGIEAARESLLTPNSSISFFKSNNNQAIQQCIEKLDSYWLSRIQPKPPEPSQLNQR